MERFRLKGIISPGRVNLPKVGTVELASLSDEQAEKLWREGCPYLEPLPARSPPSGKKRKPSKAC